MIESGMTIKTVNVSYADFPSMSGVDTKEDLAFANTLIEKHGDPMDLWNKQ